jgi:hypothetical protein
VASTPASSPSPSPESAPFTAVSESSNTVFIPVGLPGKNGPIRTTDVPSLPPDSEPIPRALPPSAKLIPAGAKLLSGVSSARTKLAPGAPRTTLDMEEQLARDHAGERGDAELGDQYDRLNAAFFGGVLPRKPVIWESRLHDLGTLVGDNFIYEGSTNGDVILLNADLKDDDQEMTRVLCHEMVHIYFLSSGNKTENHGPAFQTVLRRLFEQGAFAGTFATPYERARLRDDLVFEKSRLSAERQALDKARVRLEAERTNVRRDVSDFAEDHLDWFNRRVNDFNARSARFNTNLAAYNAKVKRYNEMLSYPDGLDAESLPRLSFAR